MKSESVKKPLEKSKNVLEEKRKNGQAENLHKTSTLTIIGMKFVQEQLITSLQNEKTKQPCTAQWHTNTKTQKTEANGIFLKVRGVKKGKSYNYIPKALTTAYKKL